MVANSNQLVLMLEDESDRLDRFTSVMEQAGDQIEFRHWRTAADFTQGLQLAARNAQPPALICLDHDLFTDHPDDPDPGDGRHQFYGNPKSMLPRHHSFQQFTCGRFDVFYACGSRLEC
jgi:hypothetical protein